MNKRAAVEIESLLEGGAEEPREAGQGHDRADVALRASFPGDETAPDQDPTNGQIGARESEFPDVVRRPLG